MDVHAKGQYEREFRDAHLDDETENVTNIGKEVCGEDLTSLLGTSVSEIVCKCLEGTYDLSTPLSYKEKFVVQTCASQASKEAGVQYQEKTRLQSQDIGRSEIGSKSIDAICDDDDVAGMILDIANESCQQASKDHGEQLQDKENVELQEKENATRNILAELSLEKTQEVSPAEENKEDTNDDNLNQYTRKRKRDSIGYDGPSFSLLTPTPPSIQMDIDATLTMEGEGNVEEELGRGKRNKKLSWQLKSPFDKEGKAVSSKADNQNTLKSSGWIKSTYTRRCIFHYAKEDEKLVKKFIVWLGKEKRRGRKKEGQID
ncbi:uncharacterized protein [Nicotiana sylvestris]|uniref:uncharacterized protein n=1 Tax=Nicotiana sylvestris TaxID=4096 RepID=UPI00388CCFEC